MKIIHSFPGIGDHPSTNHVTIGKWAGKPDRDGITTTGVAQTLEAGAMGLMAVSWLKAGDMPESIPIIPSRSLGMPSRAMRRQGRKGQAVRPRIPGRGCHHPEFPAGHQADHLPVPAARHPAPRPVDTEEATAIERPKDLLLSY